MTTLSKIDHCHLLVLYKKKKKSVKCVIFLFFLLLRSKDMDITFICFASKNKKVMVKCKLCPGDDQLSTAANKLTLFKHLQRQQATRSL